MSTDTGSTTAGAARPARQWGRTERTRRVILDAAREVFIAEGYTDANIAHIVERSGLSVGSVYHHFTGKADLFLALWSEFEAVYSEAAAAAVAAAKHAGVTDPVELFIAGSRGYLDVARGNAKLTLLFRGGDGPPGYDALGTDVGAAWAKNNMTLLGLEDTLANRLRVRILIRTVVEGESAIARARRKADIDVIIDETLAIIRRIATVA
ncbi:helix-turn-helix domain-containing protein [Gryllotalpicola koreensis]|uniref:HTH tetR-type domain-containing protein n=1 Tax=Gryllotalpicola koreensis TaxID=993086 RepID=A0ABP7ZRC5_9MICO